MTLAKSLQAAAGNAGPATPTDPQFPYVTMLLHGDGTNGAQNNTFLDASTNNFTITRNGSPTQGSFSPYGDNWSNYFDGSGDYFRVADNTALDMGGSDFTMEFWINPQVSASVAGQTVIGKRANASTYAGVLVGYWNSNLYPTIYATFNGSSWGINALTSSIATPQGQWSHVAVTRNGSTWQIWVNGVQGATTTASGTVPDNASQFSIGATSEDGSDPICKSYISNLRVVKGTAVYTAAFTPPTAPLTAITNTSLLTCQSNRFKDSSANNFTITRNGDTSVQRFSPFAPTAEYSAATIGGSGYFNNSSDCYLIGPATVSEPLNIGSSSYTIECWAYFLGWNSLNNIFGTNTPNNYFGPRTSGTTIEFQDAGANQYNFACSLSLNTWTHIALCRSGTSLRCFVNGTQVGSTQTTSISPLNTSTFPLLIGAYSTGGQNVNGYIADFRIVKGTALYTGSFTPPTAPLTPVTNTSLLLSMTNAGIYDNAMMADLETVGNAQVSTTQKKFGTGSMYFDGTGDYLSLTDTPQSDFGSGEWTVECWFYRTGGGGKTAQVVYNQSVSGASSNSAIYLGAGSDGMSIYLSTSGTSWNNFMETGVAPTLNTWVHCVWQRRGNTLEIYLNGVLQSVTSGSSSFTGTIFNSSRSIEIGSQSAGSYLTGYIDDLRITKGYARYTANFTPPAAAFPNS